MLRRIQKQHADEKGSQGNLPNIQLWLKAGAKLTFIEILHVRQEYFILSHNFPFQIPFKKRNSDSERGKFPSHGHSLVREDPQFNSLASKLQLLSLSISKKALNQTQRSTFCILCGPKPNLESHILSISPFKLTSIVLEAL